MMNQDKSDNFLLKARAFSWFFPQPTLIMGVVNLTPDSFSGDGFYGRSEEVLPYVERLISEGADLIDIGAVSTRPGAKLVSELEEFKRLLPMLRSICKSVHVPVSVDTTSARIAEASLDTGCHFINDISGLRQDPEIAKVAAKYSAGLILMHSRGTPENMQDLVQYDDLVEDICRELENGLNKALQMGVDGNHIVLDPGLGFAKDAGQNYEILAQLGKFKRFGRPILVGPSRKSFIGSVTKKSFQERVYGTAAAAALAVANGTQIVRVHDVAAIRDAVRVSEEVLKYS